MLNYKDLYKLKEKIIQDMNMMKKQTIIFVKAIIIMKLIKQDQLLF